MLLFSATMPKRIRQLAEKFMGEYDHVAVEFQQKSAVSVEQIYYDVYEKDKLRALVRLIDTEPEFYTLIFCRTRAGCTSRLSCLKHGAWTVGGEQLFFSVWILIPLILYLHLLLESGPLGPASGPRTKNNP